MTDTSPSGNLQLVAYVLYGVTIIVSLWWWTRHLDGPSRLPGLGGTSGAGASSAAGSTTVAESLLRDEVLEASFLCAGLDGALRAAVVLAVAQQWLVVEGDGLATGPVEPPEPVHPLIHMLRVRVPGMPVNTVLFDADLRDVAQSHLAPTRARLVRLGLWRDTPGLHGLQAEMTTGAVLLVAPGLWPAFFPIFSLGAPALPMAFVMVALCVALGRVLRWKVGPTRLGLMMRHQFRLSSTTRDTPSGIALAAGVNGLHTLHGTPLDALARQLDAGAVQTLPQQGDGI